MATLRMLHPHAALLMETDKKYIIISDLHIGFESKLSRDGINIDPQMHLEEMIEEISSMIRKEKPYAVILLGDIKSSVHTITKTEWRSIPEFLQKLSDMTKLILVPGNHDGSIRHLVPAAVRMASNKGMLLDDTLLIHGHTMPGRTASRARRIVMGHIHPVFMKRGSVLNGQRTWVYLRARKESVFADSSGVLDIVVVPSFNRYLHYSTHGKAYRKSISPIIKKAVNSMEKAMVTTLDGSIIGNESLLPEIV